MLFMTSVSIPKHVKNWIVSSVRIDFGLTKGWDNVSYS